MPGRANYSTLATLSAAAIVLLTVTSLRRFFQLRRAVPPHYKLGTRTAEGRLIQSQQAPAAEHAAAIAAEEYYGHVESTASAHEVSGKEGRGVAIVVKPSPPMVSDPMTRIDRLISVEQTWGRDFSTQRRRGSVGGGVGLDNGNRCDFRRWYSSRYFTVLCHI